MINILLIAYYFSPDKRVGALRASYWYDEIPRHIDAKVTVITAEQDAAGPSVFVVENKGHEKGNFLIMDPGVTWRKKIMRFISSEGVHIKADLVIMTGGPFMHFSISGWLKEKMGARVILDYRDPFATNPVFGNSWIKRKVKLYYEKKFNRQCDAITTVNRQCAALISCFDMKVNAIIENGYDERVKVEHLREVRASESYIYAGKLYLDPDPLLEALSEKGKQFIYLGSHSGQLNKDLHGLTDLGFMRYEEAIGYMSRADVGVIHITNANLSTTKVFDYMRCGLRILVITADHFDDCAVLDILDDYPNVYIAQNNRASIEQALSAMEQASYRLPDKKIVEKYSRSNQLKIMIELIDKLV